MSAYLTKIYGKGFSIGNKKIVVNFIGVYSAAQIGETVFCQFENLPMVDAVKNDWSLTELKRQYDSSLYEQIALSTDDWMIKRVKTWKGVESRYRHMCHVESKKG